MIGIYESCSSIIRWRVSLKSQETFAPRYIIGTLTRAPEIRRSFAAALMFPASRHVLTPWQPHMTEAMMQQTLRPWRKMSILRRVSSFIVFFELSHSVLCWRRSFETSFK